MSKSWEEIWNNRDIDNHIIDFLINLDGFTSKSAKFDHKTFQLYLNNIFKHIDLSSIKSCLEFGCGSGLVLYLLPNSISKSGIDYSNKLIEIAKKFNPEVDFKVQNIKFFNTTKKFDLVFANSVFQYLDDEKSIKKVLKKMISLSNKYIIIMDIIDKDLLADYLFMRKKTINDDQNDYKHLALRKSFFNLIAKDNNLDIEFIKNQNNLNENSKYRYNVILSK